MQNLLQRRDQRHIALAILIVPPMPSPREGQCNVENISIRRWGAAIGPATNDFGGRGDSLRKPSELGVAVVYIFIAAMVKTGRFKSIAEPFVIPDPKRDSLPTFGPRIRNREKKGTVVRKVFREFGMHLDVPRE